MHCAFGTNQQLCFWALCQGFNVKALPHRPLSSWESDSRDQALTNVSHFQENKHTSREAQHEKTWNRRQLPPLIRAEPHLERILGATRRRAVHRAFRSRHPPVARMGGADLVGGWRVRRHGVHELGRFNRQRQCGRHGHEGQGHDPPLVRPRDPRPRQRRPRRLFRPVIDGFVAFHQFQAQRLDGRAVCDDGNRIA